MADLGSDFDCTEDLGPNMRVVSGRLCLAQAIARRFQTPRGGLFYDPEYGEDLRRFVNGDGEEVSFLAALAEVEALKDERVESAEIDATFAEGVITLTVLLEDADGPFSFTLGVSELTVELLTFSEAA